MLKLETTAVVGSSPPDLSTGRMWQRVGDRIRELILSRTAAGISAEGRDFAPYSPEYEKEKSGGVDLRVTGLMLDSLSVNSSDSGVTLQSAAPYAADVDAKRPFLALTSDELGEIEELVIEELERAESKMGKKIVRGGSAL